MAADTGPELKALRAYERTARPGGNAPLNRQFLVCTFLGNPCYKESPEWHGIIVFRLGSII